MRAKLGYPFRFVELAEEINATMPSYVAHRAQNLLNQHGKAIHGSSVMLLGVTYKPDIADQRESPAVPLARHLTLLGLLGGFLNAVGGGGWGAMVTSTLIGQGAVPRLVIGSVNLAEFFVTMVVTATFIMTIGLERSERAAVGRGGPARPSGKCRGATPERLREPAGRMHSVDQSPLHRALALHASEGNGVNE